MLLLLYLLLDNLGPDIEDATEMRVFFYSGVKQAYPL